MKIKQKLIMTMTVFGLAAGLMSITLVGALSNNTAHAYDSDFCDNIGLPSKWTGSEGACTDAIENGSNPCSALSAHFNQDGFSGDSGTAQEVLSACSQAKEAHDEEEERLKNCRMSVIPSSIACGEEPIIEMLKLLLRIMTGTVAVAAVGGITYGALLYTSAESNAEQTKKAIGVIANVVIGIVAYALMFVLLNFMIPGGI